jgi:collagen type III alpha
MEQAMATVQEPTRPVGRAERFVQKELGRAVRRVRLLDLGRGALGLAIAFMVYGLLMMLADRWLNFSQGFRQWSLLAFAAFAAVYTWLVLLGPIRRVVNPYYAARQVEQTLPDAKNSLVNWLDLHDDNLPPTIVAALDERAAEDLKETDVDQAIRSSSLMWLAGITLGLVLGFAAAFIIFRGDQFNSLFGRAFAPFGSNRGIVKQTRISIVTPPEGNLTVAINRRVTITARVEGRVPPADRPDSLRLQIRYNADDPSVDKELPLEQSKNDPTEWTTTLNLDVIRNGFWYSVAGGDDQTPEYRVSVHSSPIVERFEVLRKYRPYLRFDPRKSDDPNIEDYRGTEVTLDAVTNRRIAEGRLNYIGQQGSISAERVPDHPETLRFKFRLEKDAKYRITFTTEDGESNNDPLPYTIHVLNDQKPEVEFTKPENLKKPEPESDLALHADELLRLEGIARDDFGIRKVTLRMKLDGQELKAKEYLTEKDYRLDTGGYMRTVEYKDAVDLTKLESTFGTPKKPETGSILEYWLEAIDNCDYPDEKGQLGSTRHYRVKVLPPKVPENAPPKTGDAEKDKAAKEEHDLKKEERDNERKQAAQDKQEQEKKHEQDRKDQSKQDETKKEQRKEDDKRAADKAEQNKQKNKGQQQKPEQGDADQQKDPNKNPENKQDPNKGDNNQDAKPNANDKFNKIKDEIAKEQNQDKKDANDPSKDNKTENGKKSKEPNPAEPKMPDNKPDDKPQEGMDTPASPKANDGGDKNKQDNAADMKPPMDQQPGGNAAGQNKDNPQDPKQPPPKAENAKGDSNAGPGEKSDAKMPPKDGGEKGANDAKAPPMPGDPKPMDNKQAGNGAEKDPKAKPNEPGAAKGAPENQQPNKNQAGKPDDAPAQPKKQDRGDGGKGDQQKDNQAKAGAPKDQPKPGEPGAADKPKDDSKSEPGASQKPKGKPDEGKNDAKNPADGKPDGKNQPGQAGKPMDNKDPAADKNPPKQDAGQGGKPNPMDAKNDGPAGEKKEDKDKAAGEKGDIAKKAEQMKNGNAQQRADAKQKLEDMAKNDPDPKKREAAKEALKDAQKSPDKNGDPADAKAKDPMGGGDPSAKQPPQKADNKTQPKDPGQPGPEKPNDKGDPMKGEQNSKPQDQKKSPADSKPSAQKPDAAAKDKKPSDKPGDGGAEKPNGQPGSADAAKPSEPKQGPKDGKGNGNAGAGGMGEGNNDVAKNTPKPGDANKPPEQPKKGEGPLQGAEAGKDNKNAKDVAKKDPTKPGEPQKGNEAQKGNGGQSGVGGNDAPAAAAGNSPPDRGVATNPNEDYKNRSGDLKLEDVDKKKLKEMFDKYKVTPEEWAEYLRQQAAKNNAPPGAANAKDFKPGDRNGGVNLNNGARRVETNPDKNPGALQSGSSGNAPREYRDAAAKFAAKLGKDEPKK